MVWWWMEVWGSLLEAKSAAVKFLKAPREGIWGVVAAAGAMRD